MFPEGTPMPFNLASGAEGDPSVLNVRVLEELVGAEREIVHDLLAHYRESARTIMAEIRTGHATDNLLQIGGATHRLKSSSRAIGALHFGDLCTHLESAAKQGKADDVAASLPPLELAFAAVERAITQCLGTP
jgi:HPt (histidine-containing phosphotransfer) domain-containing protein